mmetsp:Transcript_7464/g.9710  ORF Transcript_7464/g.9710 Transcript_7464/m.9710 type:complete len:508 (+) Transcript_7464:168-1691(+)|eukprot:CAMPEP_0198142440 /NCGR_PEP_ID=MMETSP1443-20131203/5227_1 /TAXON_ID=186043 /ORGANISM="Entomoneis sp., Strain CCMP2396" /LENGTH=507 /DNA_ID=CAMNT_0043805447 /DNA_START=142 /DNA_END=1665 /DNA_ORIENTATION=+
MAQPIQRHIAAAARPPSTSPPSARPNNSKASAGRPGGIVSYFQRSKSHFAVLVGGMLVGYILLPILVVEVEMDNVLAAIPDPKMYSTTSAMRSKGSDVTNDPYNKLQSPYFLRSKASVVETISRSMEANDVGGGGGNVDSDAMTNSAEQRLIVDHELMARQSMPTRTTPYIMKTEELPDHQRKKILVTGGAGFVGSHLVDKLMMEGQEVIVVDNFFTGQKKNIAHWFHHPNFSLVVHDVTEHLQLEVDQIYHLACPASPPHYQYNPVKTIKTSTMGTLNMLGLAKRVRARMLLTSTSEIYGDPEVHPQPESYWGNVNTIGPRSCYDEGKRVAETMMYSYKNQNAVEIRVARIFNTFGPRMHPNDGRVVSNFIIQSLQNKNITIYGEGDQTRSFQYVSDLVEGLYKLMNGDYDLPVNLGNPDEYTVKDFAQYILTLTKSESKIMFLPSQKDDPSQRKPDISTAKAKIAWEPVVKVEQGLEKTIAYFKRVLADAGEIIPTGPGAAKPEA